ncbi:hypothetical protein B9Z19DRAFT_1135901 [Tuber borchii]|uniref:Uncharacterized protein n=1 Tax=Tuber borchii TaxID=42251 RepID=A0A2T6ZC59_TUBBO|nr:hypothetical protein B9Z19DRAFT_1135901 [Tuber borchii]
MSSLQDQAIPGSAREFTAASMTEVVDAPIFNIAAQQSHIRLPEVHILESLLAVFWRDLRGALVFQERLKNAQTQWKWLVENPPSVPTPGQSGNGGGWRDEGASGSTTHVNRSTAAQRLVALAEEFSTPLSSTPTFVNTKAKAVLRNSTQALGIVTKDMLTSANGGSNSSSTDKPSDLCTPAY